MVEPTIRVMKRCGVTVGTGTGTLPVTVAMLAASIPGGASYWNSIRFEKFDIWNSSYGNNGSTEAGQLAVTVGPNAGTGQPPFQVTDHGTTGQRRAAVGFKLGLLERAHFFGTADTTVLFTVTSPAGMGANVIVHATIELMSSSLASPSEALS